MASKKTRVVHLRGGAVLRDWADNDRTMVVDVHPKPLGRTFREIFSDHYDDIRSACMSFAQAGVVVVAIDVKSGWVAGSVSVAAKTDHANAVIIGRHGMADLYLDADRGMSLRHLALVVNPLTGYEQRSGGEVRFRVLDLRTSLGFADEHGRKLEALVAEGPLFVRCGRYTLFFFVSGDTSEWPDGAEEGWQCIPERVYLEEVAADAGRPARPNMAKKRWSLRRSKEQARVDPDDVGSESMRLRLRDLKASDNKRVTQIQRVKGPSRATQSLLREGETSIGTLQLSTPRHFEDLIVGEQAAKDGILLGRYDRCDSDGATVLTDANISRVHALAVQIDGAMYVVDTASTNGTWLGPENEVRIARLDPGVVVTLGEGLANLSWVPEQND